MNEQSLVLGVSIIAILLGVAAAFLNFRKHGEIKNIGLSAMSKSQKEKEMKRLQVSLIALGVVVLLSVINIFLPEGMYRFIIPVVTVVLSLNIVIGLFDDTDNSNSKDDKDDYAEYKSRRDREIKEKAKIREQQNKRDKK